MNNNLVPELRTDKNGVTSKKWVKPATTVAAGKQWAPRPTLQDKEAQKEAIRKLVDEMHDLTYGDEEIEYGALNDWKRNLSKYREETIGRLREFFDDHSSGFRYNGGPHHTLAGMIEDGADDALVNDLITYLPTRMKRDSIIAFSHYRQQYGIEWDGTSESDPRLIALTDTARAVKRTTAGEAAITRFSAANGLWNVPIIKDPRLGRLVLERLEDNGRINDIIKERGVADCDLIVAALDDPSKALAQGVL